MLLKEFFYFSQDGSKFEDDKRYSPENDISVIDSDDTRKTRLTLKQINRARMAGEFHKEEQEKELEFIRTMYSADQQAEI